MGVLILVRHGETVKNAEGKMHMSGDPEVLNEVGRVQMQKTAQRIKEFHPTKVYFSQEKRAHESADILANELSVPPEEIEGVQERDWGIYSGKPWAEVKAVLDPMNLEERYRYVPPQGESWKAFETRLIATITKIVESVPEECVVVVTHGGAIRAMMPYLLGVSKEESFKYDPDNASITIFTYENGAFTQVLVNDTAHLLH